MSEPTDDPARGQHEGDLPSEAVTDQAAQAPDSNPSQGDASPAAQPGPDGFPPEDDGPAPGSPEGTGAVQVAAGSTHGRYLVHVRYGALPTTGIATATTKDFGKNSLVVIRTNRGTEMGLALTSPEPAEGEVGETIGHVLRKATSSDLAEQRRIEEELEPEESRFCKRKIAERGLRMRLSSVEHIFGGERIVFFFTADRRVDFRALVRDLAWHFHARIELRQVGARDEARLLADFEHCGRPLCCRMFIRHLEPVTMRMAKLQRTTLDPQKISGRCGRLMCCLRFEDQVYRELRKGLPHKGTRVRVDDRGTERDGEVISTDILAQRATVRTGNGELVRVAVSDLRPPSGTETPSGAAAAPAAGSARQTGRPVTPDGPAARGGRKGGRGRKGPKRQQGGRPARPAPPRKADGDGGGGEAADAAARPGSTATARQGKNEGRRRPQGRRRRRPRGRSTSKGADAARPDSGSTQTGSDAARSDGGSTQKGPDAGRRRSRPSARTKPSSPKRANRSEEHEGS